MTDWILQIVESAGSLGIGASVLPGSVAPPSPSDAIMPVAAAVVGTPYAHAER